MADRHYMNELGATAPGGYDDWGVGLVPAGASCTNNGVTAPAGDMVPIGAGTCTDASSNPVDPTAITKIPFGFNVNFFGTTYNGGWLNTNGGLTFDAPTSAYNQTLFSDRRFSTHNWCLPVS
jgi:hypothetical protein